METPLTAQRETAVATTGTPEVNILQIIEKMAQTPNLTTESVAALTQLVALQDRREAQQRRERFFEALARVQAKAPRIPKHGLMDRGAGKGQIKYAKREDIDAVMRPIYKDEGFSVNWDSPMVEGKIRVIGRFTAFGHTEEREWWCLPDGSGGKQGPQAAGSTVSYGQRYVSIMFWDIITEDEDANGARRESVQVITQAEADDIATALDDLGARAGTQQRAAFYKTFGISKIEDLKRSQFDEVWARINTRRKA